MTKPFLSIVTPSYNQREFLERNLLSVKTQADHKVEHVVIDGESNDGSIALLKEYEDAYGLRWISEPDRGQSHAINKGIKMARGDWIGWQNSSDYYLPDSFNIVRSEINESSCLDVVYGDLLIVDEEGKEVNRQFNTHPSKFVQRYWSLFANNQATFIKKDVFDEIGYLDEDFEYIMDADLFWRILHSDLELRHIPELLGAFRLHHNAKTFGERSEEQWKERDELYESRGYEHLVPITVLESIAKVVKASYLMRDDRWEAFTYNLQRVMK